jgi:hypothetical protein
MTPLPPLPAMAIEMLVVSVRNDPVLSPLRCDVSVEWGFKASSLRVGLDCVSDAWEGGFDSDQGTLTRSVTTSPPDNSIAVPQYKNKRRQQSGQPRKRDAMRGTTGGQGAAREAAKQ